MLFNAGRSYELLTVCQCSSLAAWSFALAVSLAVNNAIFTINVFISAAFTTSKSEKYSGGTRPLLPSYKSMTAKWPNRAACPSIRDIIAYRRSLPSTVTPAKNRGISADSFRVGGGSQGGNLLPICSGSRLWLWCQSWARRAHKLDTPLDGKLLWLLISDS